MGDQQSLLKDQRYHVQLEVFEGPLDLLLHLLRKHELDIFDIPIAFVTSRYLEYLDMMHALNLNLASEYLEMAAQLTLIKSRMMLPEANQEDDEDGDDDLMDPREELVRQLLDYQKYKTAAEDLQGRPQTGRDLFLRPEQHLPDQIRELASPGLFSLMEALKKVFERLDVDDAVNHRDIAVSRISITARIHQILEILYSQKHVPFLALFEDQNNRSAVVTSFLAILEMTKLGLAKVHQAGPMTEIHISASADRAAAEQVLSDNYLEDE